MILLPKIYVEVILDSLYESKDRIMDSRDSGDLSIREKKDLAEIEIVIVELTGGVEEV